MEEKVIKLKSYYGVVLQNEYYDQNSNILTVILPGQGYMNYVPLMHYSYKTALELGLDVLCINYGFQICDKDFEIATELDIIIEESLQILKKCLIKEYKKIILIGKSLGTIVGNKLSEKLSNIQQIHVYLTPVDVTFEYILNTPCLIITGTKDKKVNKNIINKVVENKNYELIEIDGGNHSLENFDTLKSIEMLKLVMLKLREFIINQLS